MKIIGCVCFVEKSLMSLRVLFLSECNKVAHEFAQFGLKASLSISEWIEHAMVFVLGVFVSGLVASDSAELSGLIKS